MNGKEQLWNALIRIADVTGASVRPNDQNPDKIPIIIPHRDAGVTIKPRTLPEGDRLRIYFDGFICRAGSTGMDSRSLLSTAEGCHRDASLAAELNREGILVTTQDLKEISARLRDHPVNDNDKPHWYQSASPYTFPAPARSDNLAELTGRVELVRSLMGAGVESLHSNIFFNYPENTHIRIGLIPEFNKDNTVTVRFAGSIRLITGGLCADEMEQVANEADTASQLLNLFENSPLTVTPEEYALLVKHYEAASNQEEPLEEESGPDMRNLQV